MFRKFSEINEFRVTEKSVYLLIHQKGPIAKSAIVKELGGSLTNINRFIAELEKTELITGSKGSGRKAGEYTINPDAAYSIGAYLNGDVIGIGLCNIGGQVLESVEELYCDFKTPEKVIGFFAETWKQLISHIDKEKLLGTGVAAVGPLDNDCRTILVPEQLSGWRNVPIADMFESRIQSPVNIDYFAETILMGELLFQKHDLNKDIGLLWLDAGIGQSLYNRGKSNQYHRDQSFLLAHQVINFLGMPCVCGRRGCLHTYGTISSLRRNLEPFIESHNDMNDEDEQKFREDPWQYSSDFERILKAIESSQNKPQIDYILEEMKEAYLAALGNYIYLLRPEELIFCGKMAFRFRDMFEDILRKIGHNSGYYPKTELSTSWMPLGSEKMIQGGAALVFNKYMNFTV